MYIGVDSKGGETWAELISRAIRSHPKNRMTLNMINEWMISNVQECRESPYLKSSEGWKNCIRHTLSMRPQFVRLPDRGNQGYYWTTTDQMNKMKRKKYGRSASLGSLKMFGKAELIGNNRHSSLPELPGIHTYEIHEPEMEGLTEMLQDAISSNPNLERCLNEIDLH